ncbi:unnamed protein product [Cunninghamella blakesleeana]
MLESLVSTLLNWFLGAYVSNLNYNQLQIGIWSGEVVLRNLKLKREALDKLNLPIDVLEGYLGELTLNIPWSNLKGKPVMVNIKDIYVLAVPRNEATMTVEEMEERRYQTKKRKLANAELVNSSQKVQNTTDEVKNDTFVNQLVTKIMNNLQFSISNIHVRYEDDVSVPNQRFAAGITLSELSAITTDENWIPKTIGDAINVIHKLATLESLSIYWNTDTDTLSFLEKDELKKAFQRLIATKAYIPTDHQYILKPVSGTGRIKLNKSFGNKVPKVDATLLFDELAFAIDNEQYSDAILMIDLFHSYLKKQKYYKLHPASDITPKSNPKKYFQFAAKAVLSEIHERNARWSWERLKQRRDERLQYIEYYVAEHLGNSTYTPEEIIEKLDQLERKISYEDIRFYRSLAKSKIKRMKAVMEAEEKQRKKIETEAAKNSTANQGWLSSWWYGQTTNNPNSEESNGNSDDSSLIITEEQKQEFYDAIEYDEDKAAIAESIEIPKDTMLLQLRTSLNKGSFTVNQRKYTSSDHRNALTSELVSLVFDSVMLGSVLYLESWKASAILGDLRLYDGVTHGTRYHQLVGVNRNFSPQDHNISSSLSPLHTDKPEFIQTNESTQHNSLLALKNPFFSAEYEYRPLDKRADNAITLKMRNIDIVYNPIIFNEIINFFKPPESSIESINALVVAAGDTFEDIKKQTRSTLTFALEQHTTFDLHVDMDAPIIMVPESCTDEVSRGIVIDAGHINIESQLVPQDVVEKVIGKRQQQTLSNNQMDDNELRSLMYDRFSMKLTQTKILIGDSVDTCLRQIHQPTQELNYLHFVDRIDMGFLLELSILDYASSELPKFKMSGHLPLLNVNFSDTKYRAIMQLPQLIAASGLFGNDNNNINNDLDIQYNNPNMNDIYTKNNMKQNDLMNVQLWRSEDEDLFLDSDSEYDEEDNRHLYDTLSDVSYQTSSSTTQPSYTNEHQNKQQRQKISNNNKNQVRFDQRLFTLDFRVDKVTASVSQHIPSSSKRSKEQYNKDGILPTETLLCTLSLQGLSLGYTLRPCDMSLNLTLQSLDMVDQMKDGTEFKYLVTSNHDVLKVQSYMEADNSNNHSKELVQLYYIQVDTSHPGYEKTYNKIDRTVKLTLSTLNFVVTCSSVLTLYNFAMSTFIDPEQKVTSPSSRRTSMNLKGLPTSEGTSPLSSQQDKQQNIQIQLFLDSVNLILNNDGTRIATGELSHGDLLIFVMGEKMDVRAKFANFTLTDDITNANNVDNSKAFLGNQMLTIQGEELIDLKYETFPKNFTNKEEKYFYDIDYPGYDQSLYLRMGSAQFTFMEKPVCELLIFLSKFSALKSFYDKARQAALETAQHQRMLKTHIDIVIRTPIVFFPDTTNQHREFTDMKPLLDIVTAHLGEIWISNSYIEMKDRSIINSMKAGIRAMHLSSKYHHVTPPTVIEPNHQVKIQTLPIVDDIDLTFDITIPFSNENQSNEQKPAADVYCELSRVSMHLTERQYTFLLDSVQMISRIISTVQQDDLPISVDNTNSNQSHNEFSTIEQSIGVVSTTNNLQNDSSESQDSESSQYKMLIKMPSIEFEIYSEEDNSQLPQSLSKFALNDSSLNVNGKNNGGIDIKLQIRTLMMDDTRKNIQSKFRKIIPAIQQGYQITVQCDLNPPSLSSSGNLNRYGILLITVNEPKVIVSLDHIFMVYKFITAPILNQNQQPIKNNNGNSNKNTSQKKSVGIIADTVIKSSVKTKAEQQVEESSLELSYRLNITNVEFILLANPDAMDTEAVVLSAETIMLSQQSVMALVVKQMGMFLCHMNSRSTSTLRFIQPFDISISMNNNQLSDISDNIDMVKELEMDVDALILRLSYRDAMLVTEIFNKAFYLYQKANENAASIQQESENKTDYTQSLINASTTTSTKNNTNKGLITGNIKESLRASFQGMQVILIEEVHEFPMVDMTLKPFKVNVSDWSKSFSANVAFSAYVNYFNIKNSHWEPLVEPWQFKLNLSKKDNTDDPFKINITSNTDLNINFTHTFLESTIANIAMFDKRKNSIYSGERGHESPYKIRNRTGYPIHVWNSKTSPNKATGDVTIHKIEDGKEVPWWFEDWRKRREMTESVSNIINVQLEGALWETIRGVHVDTEGEHVCGLRPLIRNVQHHLVFDIKLVDNVKIVTIRSALVIENRTLLPIDVTILDSRGYSDGTFTKIAPGDDYPLPIEKAYHNRFCIRPDAGFGYKWTSHAIHWTDFVKNDDYKTTINCVSEQQGDMPPFIFQMYSRQDKSNPLYSQYCFMSIRLSAPVEIENLLPYDFNFRIIDKTARQDYSSFLRRGGTIPLHVVENKHLLLLNIHLTGSEYKPSDFAIISTKGTDDLDIDDTLQLKDKYSNILHLKLNIIEIPESGGSFKYSVYSPYIIINKTGWPISLKPKLAWQNSMFSSQASISVCHPANARHPSNKIEPFMYSYPKHDNKNRSLIQITGSEYSQPLSFEAVRSIFDVTLPTPSHAEEFHLGVNVQEGVGKYKLTKMVTFTPRFIISNHMNVSIRYREPESRDDQEVKPQSRTPLYRVRKSQDKQLCIKLPGIDNVWSAPFNIQDIGKVHVRLNSSDGSTVMLLRVDTIMEDATIYIVLSKEFDNEWPYLFVNRTNEDMSFYQESPTSSVSDDYSSNTYSRMIKIKKYLLPAHSSVPYSWDMPAVKDRRIILNVNGRERSINVQEIGSQLPIRHTTRRGYQTITSIDIKTKNGIQQIVELYPFKQGNSLFRPLSPSTSTSSIHSNDSSSSLVTMARDGFETIDVKPIIYAIVQIKLSHIGISLINKRLQELAYITFRGMEIKLTDSNMYQSLRWNIKWLQIDNQLYSTMFPILLYPTNMTKDTGQEILPTFQLALDRVKDDSHGVLYFKYFSVLLQELSLEMDEGFVYEVIDFIHIDVTGWNNPSDKSIWEYSTEIPDAKPQEGISRLYFEMLSIQPIRFELSFLKGTQGNSLDERNQKNTPISFFVNILTMAIGNINNAPVSFNALAVENLMANQSDLANRIYIHYSDQFFNQIHKIIGSADFLGNPVGLFSNLSSGVAELFYEPWQGFIMSDRPQDLGMGIARGFSGFVRKSVFGVTDSFTKFTGSIGKGLSAATMDREYQERRRMNMARNKPRHALVGVTQGANYFANSVASGFTGLVTQPIEGASKEGVGGFFAGVGKGLVGAVTKPVVGVFDLASNVTEGIRNTTTASDTNDIERIRFPRFIGESGVLKPYSTRESQGQYWLKDVNGGKYMEDNYISHCHLQQNDRVAMLTSNRLMLLRTQHLNVEWQEPFTNIQTIKCETTGIAIYLRSMSWEPFLIIPDRPTREWFFKKIEETVIQYNAARSQYNKDNL